jgi:hypothetical protein
MAGSYANPFGSPLRGFEELSPFSREYLSTVPTAGYSYLGALLGGTNPFQRWLANQYDRYWGNYQAQAANALSGGEPSMSWLDYLQGINPQQEYAFLSPLERGEFHGLFAPRSRWIR